MHANALHLSQPQPGGREPAPGGLALVQAYATSHFDLDPSRRGADVWGDAPRYRTWLADRGLDGEVGDEDVRHARRLREVLRALAYANHAGRDGAVALRALERHAAEHAAPLAVAFDPPRLVAAGNGHAAAVAHVAAAVAEAQRDGTWARLKACPGPHCGWVFFDGSRNRSARWCSMAVCGSRVKTARHRRH